MWWAGKPVDSWQTLASRFDPSQTLKLIGLTAGKVFYKKNLEPFF